MDKKFIEEIMHESDNLVVKEFMDREDGHAVKTRSMSVPNKDKSSTICESIKRCYYLKKNEKLVLFGLYSFANKDGKCEVPIQFISLKIGISPSNVGKWIKSLAKKKLIHVKRLGRGRPNVYTLGNLNEAPYLILSESLYSFIETYKYKRNKGTWVWREAIKKEAKKEKLYEPYLVRLAESPKDYSSIIACFREELLQLVNERIPLKVTKL